MPPNQIWRVDLHSHTSASPDCATPPAVLVARARRAGLQRIAITDHDTIRGAVIARDLAPDLVIVGEEIRTASGGEILALYVQEEVPTGLPVQEVIRRLRAQGAVISVSHPLDRFRKRSALGWAGTQVIIGLVDALEGFNARCLSAADNQRAAELAAQHGLALTGGSDAHTPGEVGSGYVMLPPFADTPADFVTSLRAGQLGGHLSGIAPHFWSTIAKLRGSR